MRGIDRRKATRFGAFALGVAFAVAGCAPAPRSLFTPAAPNGQEHMPAFAGIWLTSEPAAPIQPVNVEVTAAQHPDFHRAHTFDAGVVLRGSIPVSSGRYRLVGLGGACALDLFLGAERETDVAMRALVTTGVAPSPWFASTARRSLTANPASS